MWSNVKLWIRKVENSPGLSGLTSRGGKSLRRSTAAPEDSRLGLMNLQIQHLHTKLEAKEPKNPLTKNEYYRQMSSYKLPNQAEVFYFGIVWWPVLLTRGLFTWRKRRNEIWRGMQTPNLSVNRILLPKGSSDSCGITCWYVFPSIVCPFSQREFVRNRPKPFQSHDSRLVLTLLWHLWVHLFYLCINYIPRKPKHVVDLMMTSGRPGRSDGRGDPCAGCPGRLAGHHVWHPTFPHWVAFPFRHTDAHLARGSMEHQQAYFYVCAWRR